MKGSPRYIRDNTRVTNSLAGIKKKNHHFQFQANDFFCHKWKRFDFCTSKYDDFAAPDWCFFSATEKHHRCPASQRWTCFRCPRSDWRETMCTVCPTLNSKRWSLAFSILAPVWGTPNPPLIVVWLDDNLRQFLLFLNTNTCLHHTSCFFAQQIS